MKFLRVMLAAALCAAALAGCGSSEKGGSAYTTDDVNKIAEAGAFSEELETVDADTAFAPVRSGRRGAYPGAAHRLRRAALRRGHL